MGHSRSSVMSQFDRTHTHYNVVVCVHVIIQNNVSVSI